MLLFSDVSHTLGGIKHVNCTVRNEFCREEPSSRKWTNFALLLGRVRILFPFSCVGVYVHIYHHCSTPLPPQLLQVLLGPIYIYIDIRCFVARYKWTSYQHPCMACQRCPVYRPVRWDIFPMSGWYPFTLGCLLPFVLLMCHVL